MNFYLTVFLLVLLSLLSSSVADVSSKFDKCEKTDDILGMENYAISTTNCVGDAPFVDPRDIETAQCRVLCERYSNSTFSINPVDAQCDLCKSDLVLNFFGPEEENYHDICVPLEVCEKTCGKAPPGCLYTGSCSRYWCTVSNDGNATPADLVELDAPGEEGKVYGVLPGTTVSQVSISNSSGAVVSSGITDSNSSSSGSSETGAGDAIGNTAGDDSSKGKVLSRNAIIGISAGVVGVIVTALVTIIVTFINRKKKGTDDLPTPASSV